MILQEFPDGFVVAFKNNADVFIPRFPGISQEGRRFAFKYFFQFIAKPIEGVTKRLAPALVPVGLPSCVTSAVSTPSLHAMRTTPGAVLMHQRFIGGLMFGKKLGVIG